MSGTPPSAVSVLLAALLGCANGADTVPEVSPLPPSWDRFVVLMWQYTTDVRRDQGVYESLNLNGFHVDRSNPELVALGKSKSWPFYVDHAADKGYLHLGSSTNHPNVKAILRKTELLPRPNSLADPATIQKMHDFLTKNITAAKGSTAVAYAFDDEISLGHFCNPIETDTSPYSIALYRKYLETEYQTIAALNAQYGTQYANFSSVNPVGFESMRGQLTRAGIAQVNFSAWCDWRAAMDTQFADVLSGLTRFTNGLDDSVPAGFVGGQHPSPWGGYDWRKLSKAVQWVECYDIGAANTILRSFWPQQRPRMQTFFSSKNERLDAWFLWYSLCQGNRGVIAWPDDWIKDGKAGDNIVKLAPTFKEIQGPVSQAIIDGELQTDGVALYYSHPSVQMSWALDAACHGKTWPNRSSSMDNRISTGGQSRVGWVKSLQDAGVQPDFIHQDHLLDGALAKRGIKLLILNRVLCLSDAEATAIRTFARAGGTVVADHLCGIFDEHGKARATGVLDDLFGVQRDLTKGWFNGQDLTELNGEKDYSLSEKNWALGAHMAHGVAVVERGLTTVGAAKSESVEGTSVIVRNGKSVYLNLSPIGYLLHRSDEQGKGWRDLVTTLLTDSGIRPKLMVTADDTAQIESLFWKNGRRTTVCVIKNLDRAATINSFGEVKGGIGEAAVTITLEFAKPVKDLRNVRTGAVLGAGTSFTDTFVPWEANIYTYAN